MMKMVIATLFFIGLNSCNTKVHRQDCENQIMTYLKSNLEFLASDELQGRETSTFGGYAAGLFITNQLKKYGIEPFGEEDYFQNFKIKSITYNGSRVTIESEDKVDSLKYLRDYFVYSNGDSVNHSAIVFVGYGMIDTANNINDYKNIDVKGKTVLALRGIPSGYNGSRRATYLSTKNINAYQAGAVGCLVIYSAERMKNWSMEIENAGKEKIGRFNTTNINTIVLDSLITKKLLKMPAKTYAEIRKGLEDGLIEKGAILKETISWQLKGTKKDRVARNIIGILKGTDPAMSKEYVSIGSHYDHVGIKDSQIHNGADDNSSGTTATLECARQLALIKENKRSVLFYFWDAEEKGLLGSEFYTKNYDNISEIVVNINLDMVGREHVDSLAVIGSGKLSSELFYMVENINKQSSNFVFDYTFDNENHPEHFYRRSDQWSFVRRGVPAVFFFDSEDKDYHTPRDDADKINYLKIKKVVTLASRLALKVANLDHKLVVDNANISGMDLEN